MMIIIGIGIFITVILLIEGGFIAYRIFRDSEARRTKHRLRTLSAGGSGAAREIDIVRKRLLSEVPWLSRLLLKINRAQQLDRLLEHANTRMTLGFFIFLSILLAALGIIIVLMLGMHMAIAVLIGVLFGAMPFLYLISLRQKRMEKFQEQLPDALDLMARALRAGHAFSGGMKMVAEEFDDPLGTEFRKTIDEINFGVGVDLAMKNLVLRVDCPDLQFFVVSVIIQRETGGNLAEILEKIALLVRERFKLYGKIRSLAAEGKLSAVILLALPPVMAMYFVVVQPEYVGLLISDPIGIAMIVGALIMMALGTYVMKRMIEIKV